MQFVSLKEYATAFPSITNNDSVCYVLCLWLLDTNPNDQAKMSLNGVVTRFALAILIEMRKPSNIH